MEFTLRYYKAKPLVVIILLLASAIDNIIANFLIPLFECLNNENSLDEILYVIRAPTNTALIVSILALYDNYLWKHRFFKHLVNVPNLNGRYKGVLNSSYTDKPIYSFAEIKQTASKIKIQFYFKDGNNQETSSKRTSRGGRKGAGLQRNRIGRRGRGHKGIHVQTHDGTVR